MRFGILSLALKNMRGRRKKVIVNVLLLILAMLIILLSQLMVDAYKRYIYATGVEPLNYSSLMVYTENIQECYETMQDMFRDDERVSMIDISYTRGGSAEIVDSGFTKLIETDLYMNLGSYFSFIEKYMDEPIDELGEYDIVMPRYVFDTDYAANEIADNVPYIDMKQYIGQSIDVMIYEKPYTLQIVGVYDNVHAQKENDAYMSYDTIKALNEPKEEEDKENGVVIFSEHCYLWVDKLEDREAVQAKVNDYYKSQDPIPPHGVGYGAQLFEGYIEYIEFLGILGTTIGVLVWCWAFFSILLVTIKDIGQRMHEFAVLRSVGYLPQKIYIMVGIELSVMTAISLVISGIATMGVAEAGNYYVENKLNPFWRTLQFQPSVQSIAGCLILGLITAGFAWIFAIRRMRQMSVIKELKG